MNLQGRNLSLDMQGEDVQLLHYELRLLGYAIDSAELEEMTFGASTEKAVQEFRKQHVKSRRANPAATERRVEVGGPTAKAINARVDRLPKPTVTGRVVDQETGKGIAGARIEALEQQLLAEDVIADAETDADGAFRIELTESRLFQVFRHREPKIAFRVYDDETLLSETQDTVVWRRETGEAPLTIEVAAGDATTPVDDGVVRGRVHRPDGGPIAGVVVRAYDRKLRGEELLGEAVTDRSGQYEIAYTTKRARKRSMDLRVGAFDQEGVPLSESMMVFAAQPGETVDLTVPALSVDGGSQYEQVMTTLMPLLEKTSPADLDAEGVAYLAGKTGIESSRIEAVVEATRLGEQAGLSPDVLFALRERGMPIDAEALLEQRPAVIREVLVAAVQDGIVSESVGKNLDAITENLARRQVDHLMAGIGDLGPVPGELVQTLVPAEEQRRLVAEQFVHHEGPFADFVRDVREDPRFGPDLADVLEFTAAASAQVGNYPPLIRQLHELRTLGTIRAPRDLAKLDTHDWLKLSTAQPNGQPIGLPPDLPGNTDEEKAQHLVRRVEATFPTASIAYRLQRDDADGLPFTPNEKRDLATFILDNPNFGFETAIVDQFVEQRPAADGVGDDNQLREHLKRMQRVFKFAPRYDEIRPLLADGLDSALAVTHLSKEDFTGTYGEALGEPARAEEVYERASQTSAMALTLFARLNQVVNSLELPVTGDSSGNGRAMVDLVTHDRGTAQRLTEAGEDTATATLSSLRQSIPDLETLFGSLDLCDCAHCRSVYGPAAYLVDMLSFLKIRPARVRGKTALDVLSAPGRRPDLGRIELSCQNTNTPVPYVDLVNEVLEDAIAPRRLLPIPLGHWPLNEGLGTAATDVSITGNHGVLPNLPNRPTWAEGRHGPGTRALSFDGADDYVSMGAPPSLVMKDALTIAAWIYPTGPGGGGVFVNKEGEYQIAWFADETIRWGFANTGPSWYWSNPNPERKVPTGKWAHVAVVFDKGMVSTHVNGSQISRVNARHPHYLSYKAATGDLAIDRVLDDGKGSATIWRRVDWVEDDIPAGATPYTSQDVWNWVNTNPTPFSGSRAHQSTIAAGIHQHLFTGATAGLALKEGDRLFAYVYLDPANLPETVMLQWDIGTDNPAQPDWEHRAYWGKNLIPWGTDGTNSRRFMGALPSAGQWVRLEVPAQLVGLEGRTVIGMAFTLYGGRATWDRAGKMDYGWTALMPFELNSHPHYLAYNVETGNAAIDRIPTDGRGSETIWTAKWTPGWTALVPLVLDEHPHYLSYKVATGDIAIDRVRNDGRGSETIWSSNWGPGWTAFMPFELGGRSHLLTYNAVTRDVAIDRLRIDGQGSELTLWRGKLKTGWTALVPLMLNEHPHYLAYNNQTGNLALDRIRNDGKGIEETIWSGNWGPGWTALMPYEFNGRSHLLSYNAATGDAAFDRLRANGQGSEITLWRGRWSTGWTALMPLDIGRLIGDVSSAQNEFRIGGRQSALHNFAGRIADVRIYNQALRADEVQAVAAGEDWHGRQTRGTAEELSVTPEHTNAAAYDTLATAVYPWSLPFNSPVEEARAYLNLLGADRHELMQEFSGRDAAYVDLDIATEYLGLTTVERELVSGGLPVRLATTANLSLSGTTPAIDGVMPAVGNLVLAGNQTIPAQNGLYVVKAGPWERAAGAETSHVVTVTAGTTGANTNWLVRPIGGGVAVQRLRSWDFWGLNEKENPVEVFDPNASDASTRVVTKNLGWLETLGWVREFLKRSTLDYEQLLELLATRYINPIRAIRLQSADPTDLATCDLAKLTIIGLDERAAARVHRFVRLWRRLGWTIHTLDEAITVLGAGVADIDQRVNDDLIRKLFHVARLHDALGVPVEQLLVFWGSIPTRGDDSLYARLFLNKAVINPPDAAFPLAAAVPGPVAHWRFDEGSGTTAVDSAGKGNVGTLNGPTRVAGQVGGALSFDGVDDVVDLTAIPARDVLNSFTVAFWANPQATIVIDPQATTGIGRWREQRFVISAPQGGIRYQSPDHACAGVSVGTNGISVYEHSDEYMPALLVHAAPISGWTHIAVVYENRTPQLYLNGILQKIGLTGPKTYVHINPAHLGAGTNYGYYKGGLDDVRIYGRALSVEEVQAVAANSDLAVAANREPAIFTTNPVEAKISKHKGAIRAALEITDDELATLAAALVPDDTLNLATLSALFRHTRLAQGLNLPFADLIALKEMAGINPFDPVHTETAPQFIDLVGRIRAAGFAVVEIDYLLHHRSSAAAGITISDAEIALVLDGLRTGLRRIQDETTIRPDLTGEETQRVLASLQWPAEVVERAIATLSGTATFEAPLAALPAGLTIPPSLAGRVSYDAPAKMIRVVRPLTLPERDSLAAASTDVAFRSAVDQLFRAPRTFVTQRMKAFAWPAYFAALTALPAGLVFPPELRDRVYYDASLRKVSFAGLMTDAEKRRLDGLSSDSAYRAAVQLLYDAPTSYAPPADNAFLVAADAATLFDVPKAPAERFELVLRKLLDHVRSTASRRLVVQTLGVALGVETRIVEPLLTEQLRADSDTTKPAITDFLIPSFAESNPNVQLSAAAFPAQFKTYMRLGKLALLGAKLKLTATQFGWLPLFGPTVPKRKVPWIYGTSVEVGWLLPNDIPGGEIPRDLKRFAAWLRLVELCALRDSVPGGEATLGGLFELARLPAGASQDTLLQWLSERTGWPRIELDFLANPKILNLLNLLLPRDFMDEVGLLRLVPCVQRTRATGASAAVLSALAAPQLSAATADAIRQTVKSRYTADQWPAVAKPTADALREKQRAALVSHVVAHPAVLGRTNLRNADELYEHFLIDVGMSPCQTTSRIKQAISSVQLFVQRCLMKLEPEVALTPQDAAEWGWMKNYRVWEANRKVFLYPENWIEPELRDDKSPFFQEFEDELLQNEVTAEAAEGAFLHYLEKLDSVARLEVCGMYHELDWNERDELTLDVLHVFGRTMADPRLYYYRRRVDSAWTAWEQVDVDIQGNYVIPVVFDRRLYLFWPILTLTAQEPKPTELSGSLPPKKQWEIQVAWSEYNNGQWSVKAVSPDKIRIDELLDQTKPDARTTADEIAFTGSVGWLSASEGGYGDALALYLSTYRFNPRAGTAIQVDRFRAARGQRVPRLARPLPSAAPQMRVTHQFTVLENMTFLYDQTWMTDSHLESGWLIPIFMSTPEKPTEYRIVPAHQYLSPILMRRSRALGDSPDVNVEITPFFYQDARRTFFFLRQFERRDSATEARLRFTFQNFYHYYVQTFIQELNRNGIDGLLSRDVQLLERQIFALFEPRSLVTMMVRSDPANPQSPMITLTSSIEQPYPTETVEFAYGGTYAQYNWELFFHGPLLAADHLSRNQRFAEAQAWFHYIFDPTGPAPHGLKGTYFGYSNLTGASVTRVDPVVNFTWGAGSPDPEFAADYFSVRWTGKVQPEYTEKYTFYTRTDDGVRLWVNNVRLIDKWIDQGPTEYEGTIDLVAGQLYDIKMEYYERGGWAQAELRWSSPRTPKAIIPQSRLYPDLGVAPDAPANYWNVRPFFEAKTNTSIHELLKLLSSQDEESKEQREQIQHQVREWRKNPFNPHLIARLRTNAYQKTVVMKYLDNLIAWGDQLFRQDTMESINEATQLYVLAAAILGKRPAVLPERPRHERTFDELRDRLDAFSNALVRIENLVPASVSNGPALDGAVTGVQSLSNLALYFGIPRNDKLFGYWDTVADRLFKIRHCQNIEGVERQLPLFEPPIDPALVAKATAAGLDIGGVLGDGGAALPHYRFGTMAQKATELCADVKALGAALLSALEKRDAEQLALLRSDQEVRLLTAVRVMKERQVEEARQTLESLRLGRRLTELRHDYYTTLTYTNRREREHIARLQAAQQWQTVGQLLDIAASYASYTPNVDLGVEGVSSPVFKAVFGGSNIAFALQMYSKNFNTLASIESHHATLASIVGGWDRRWEEWQYQKNQAAQELPQIDKQIAAAEIRIAIAERDLVNHDLQVENAKNVDEYMRDKYTNRELYDWTVSQVSAVYFQSYQLAYDVAKRAERAFRYELGLTDSNFIQFGYWDGLQKGLLAGERLHHDLKRMEVAYLDQNLREYEMTKHVSLASLDAAALLRLRQAGECFFSLPEALFDLDSPGTYLRRIKSVSVTIPSVTGPYTSVNCKLSLLKSSVRHGNTLLAGKYGRQANDPRFVDSSGAIESIVTSSGQNDSGLFETNLRDERYLPFEGRGAISQWRLELPNEFRQFDYDTISDVIFHVRYTGRDAGLKQQAVAELQSALNQINVSENEQGLVRLFSARHEFPGEWHRFLHPATPAGDQTLTLGLSKSRFPYFFDKKAIKIGKIDLFMKVGSQFAATHNKDTVKLSLAKGTVPSTQALTISLWNGLLHAEKTEKDPGDPGDWMLKGWLEPSPGVLRRLDAEAIEEIMIVCHYTVS